MKNKNIKKLKYNSLFFERNYFNINILINIVFGNYHRGEKTEEIHNMFKAESYERIVKIENIRDIDIKKRL